jgi:histidine kinase/DNA gyrase B/HSP90-like ATPase
MANDPGSVLNVEEMAITPSPRILQVLAHIEFDPWQCVAELIDNAFDEFLDIARSETPWGKAVEVAVQLPSSDDETLVVSDNGRGLTLDQVQRAVTAGFTGNDPFSKLGLFGMGFNVATARIGRVTTFLSTREGDPEWHGLQVDIGNIGEDFRVPVVHREKASPDEHGSRVEVTELSQFARYFTRPANQTRLRDRLGGIYSWLLDEAGFKLTVNDIVVSPRRHCVWSAERSVTRSRQAIPARIVIDHALTDQAVCRQCGLWQEADEEACAQCDATGLERRERRIHGWLGIARDLDSKEFGIDFLRNGRKILRFNRSIFQWRDPEDPSDPGEPEYPIEVPQGQGRIVGEIHLDHVPVSYTKDSFETSDRSWRYAVKVLRGEGPLRPREAKSLGYEPNDSPLAKLFAGYRRNDPGRNYLMPGNGRARLDTSGWVKKFHEGDADYQEDTRWWEAVEEHERIAEEAKRRREEDDAKAAEGLEDPTREFTEEEDGPSIEEEIPEDSERDLTSMTDRERIETLIEAGRPLAELNNEYTAFKVPGRAVTLRCYRVSGLPIEIDGNRLPVWLTGQPRNEFLAFVDLNHPLFERFDDDPADLILTQLAHQLLVRAEGRVEVPISAVYADLKARYLTARAIDPTHLVPESVQVMRDIQERMVGCIAENPARPWENALSDYERHFVEDRIHTIRRESSVDDAIYNGEYLMVLPASFIPRVVEEWPEAFFDGKLFAAPYSDVSSPSGRRQIVAGVTSYLQDVAWLTEAAPSAPREQLIRARLSLELLPDELSEIDTA